MIFAFSLRLRLLFLILVPLLLMSVGALSWQYRQSVSSANAVFDQKLSLMTLAIFSDMQASGGESLSPATKALFEEAGGALFFYHVRGPDGGFVTGYSPPPVRPKSVDRIANELVFFDSTHRGREVHVVQLRQIAQVDQLTGDVVVSVWQDRAERQNFTTQLVLQGLLIAGLLLLTVLVVVFFGIGVGLRPLRSLESAISQRSSSDLSPIQRQVPQEVETIVQRLNELFRDVRSSQKDQDRFISNAAHQLRNPVAGIQALAEVASRSQTLHDAKERLRDLTKASQSLSRLTQQLLSYERVRQTKEKKTTVMIDSFLRHVVQEQGAAILKHDVALSFEPGCGQQTMALDEALMAQAIANLIDNALVHGGANLSHISVESKRVKGVFRITVANDGMPVPKPLRERIFERFEQGGAGEGTGLGLAIVKEIAQAHQASVGYRYANGSNIFTIIFDG
ncbi:MAG: sensor histidine kinase N-terminal domain-containing protein [Candidatus Puniceispirillaceae bacterium]